MAENFEILNVELPSVINCLSIIVYTNVSLLSYIIRDLIKKSKEQTFDYKTKGCFVHNTHLYFVDVQYYLNKHI